MSTTNTSKHIHFLLITDVIVHQYNRVSCFLPHKIPKHVHSEKGPFPNTNIWSASLRLFLDVHNASAPWELFERQELEVPKHGHI